MCSKRAAFVTLVIAVVTSYHTSLSVILRPDWFPYFRHDAEPSRRATTLRTERYLTPAGETVPCPPDMTEYECYHTFMAVWTRLLQTTKRGASPALDREAQEALLARIIQKSKRGASPVLDREAQESQALLARMLQKNKRVALAGSESEDALALWNHLVQKDTRVSGTSSRNNQESLSS